MLNAKFVVPFTRNFHTNILKFSQRNHGCSEKVICDKLQNARKGKGVLSKNEECREKYIKCPNECNENVRGKVLPSKFVSECKVKTTVDDYRAVHENVTNQAKTILTEIQVESESLMDKLKRDIEAYKRNEQNRLKECLYSIKKQLQKLLLLDPSFGSIKRKSVLSLSEQIRQAFDELECNIAPQVKRLNEINNNLERDTQFCVERAKALVLACRKCKNPVTLSKCIEENGSYAEKILEKTSLNVKASLAKIGELQREILEYHKSTISNVSKLYHGKSKEFSQHLDDCIRAARQGRKK